MGDQHDRSAEFPLQFLHQRQDLRLHGNVECRRRLVGDQHLGSARQCHRDHHALPHAAGKLVRILRHAPRRLGDVHRIQHAQGDGTRRSPLGTLMFANGLGQLLADRHHGIERCHWLLKDHRDIAAAHAAHRTVGELREFAPFELDAAGGDPQRGFRQEPHDSKRSHGFARAALAGNAQRFAAHEVEADGIKDPSRPLRRQRIDAEAIDAEHGCCRCHEKTILGK